jgi:hypothetical protein
MLPNTRCSGRGTQRRAAELGPCVPCMPSCLGV